MIRQHRLGSPREATRHSHEDVEKRLLEELRKTFRPEFLNRVDEIIVFDPLDARAAGADRRPAARRTCARLVEGQGMHLEVTEAAKEYVAEQGYDAEYGARPLKRAIQRLIENPLSQRAAAAARSTRATPSGWTLADGALVFAK